MFCPECGTQLRDNAKFCNSCGAEQKKAAAEETQTQIAQPVNLYAPTQAAQAPQTMQPMQPVQSITLEPVRPVKKPAAAKIVSIAVAIALVLGLGVAAFIFVPRFLSGSKPKADNCVAVTLNALENMGDMSSVRYSVAVDDDGEVYEVNGYLSLGKDLYSSVFEVGVDFEDDYYRTVGRAVFHGGFLGISTHSIGDDWDNMDYEYIDVKEILDSLFGMASEVGVDVDELGIDVNNFVKNGRINYDEFKKINDKIQKDASKYLGDIEMPDFGGDFEGDFDISRYYDKLPALSKELNKMVENFLYVECEKAAFLGEFVSGPSISKEGGSTTYKYAINPVKMTKTLAQYMVDSISKTSKYPELSAVLGEIADAQKMTLDELLSFMSYGLRNALEEMVEEDGGEIRVSVTLSKNRLPEKITVSFETESYDWDYDGITDEWTLNTKTVTVSVTLTLSDHNSVKPDLGEIGSFMKKAEENNR